MDEPPLIVRLAFKEGTRPAHRLFAVHLSRHGDIPLDRFTLLDLSAVAGRLLKRDPRLLRIAILKIQ